MNIVIDNYNIVKKQDGTIMLKPKMETIIIKTIEQLKDYNCINSKILSVKINNTKYSIKRFTNVLVKVYKIIDDGVKIIKKSKLNLSTKNLNNDDYRYIEEVGISFQKVSINKCILELFTQCIENSVDIELKIEFLDSKKMICLKN